MDALRHILLILTCRCEQAELIRLKAGYGEAHWAERLAERLHRLICRPCRKSVTQSKRMDAVVHAYRERSCRGEEENQERL